MPRQSHPTWLRTQYRRYARKTVHFALSALLRRVPGDFLTLGPPRRVGTARHTSESAGGFDCRTVVPRERLVFDEPRSIIPPSDFWGLVELSPDLGPLPRTDSGSRYFDIPPGNLYTIPGGRALGIAGWIVDGEDRLLTDLSPDYVRERYIRSRHPVMNQLRLPTMRSIRGTVAVLATLAARDFYAHWMMDLLPRAAMIARAGIRFEDLDGIYVSKPRDQRQVDLFAQLGIQMDQIIDADVVPHVRAEQLLVPSCHANVFFTSKWCCETLRALSPLADVPTPGPEFIYVSRSGTKHRRLLNEEDLLRDVLLPRGFVPVWPEQLPLDQQTALFASAKVVVTPLGSSVVNLIHCRPGTQIVEIMNPRCVQPCGLAIATQVGLGHHVVLAQGANSAQHEIREDLVVPRRALEDGIRHAFAYCL